ncbi:hypothetical protein CSKR_201718 [Clonorchis sinensis]|uniref:Uncharacterized protein n=1 Tax=Clonorchis sinensis TaxID=79923 RepID=A0A8T1MTP4_CLOSI|nr:hypothetical protein CSKR_201718 [Clonorchis sinensis]
MNPVPDLKSGLIATLMGSTRVLLLRETIMHEFERRTSDILLPLLHRATLNTPEQVVDLFTFE